MTKHYILSSFLKASKTFDVYKSIFSKKNLQHVYEPVEIPTESKISINQKELNELKKFIDNFKNDPEAKSIVVSNPYKQIIPKYCDELKGQAIEMSTVNLIIKSNGKLVGENIDGEAFFLGQKNIINLEFEDKTILILGCGGVSTAVSFTICKHSPKKIILFDINQSKLNELEKKLTISFPNIEISTINSEKEIINIRPDIIYNGTGIGKTSDDPQTITQTPITNIPANCICIDANYTPWETKFLKLAKEKQCKTLNGFSHMIAFTTLHLNKVIEQKINFDFVFGVGNSIIHSDQQNMSNNHSD